MMRELFTSFIRKAEKSSRKSVNQLKEQWKQVQKFICSNNCMTCDILDYQGQHETKTCKKCTICAQKRRNSKMITNEYGIHTFSLKLQCKYSEIQNIIEQNECICTVVKGN